MEKIIEQRGGGKTTQLIQKSAETGDYIVCHNMKEASKIQAQAKDMDLQIPFPMTYREFLRGEYMTGGINGFLIDNAEMLLQYLSNVPVNAITMNP